MATERQLELDRTRLHELGYAQELLRAMGGFSNFAVSFTIISILSGWHQINKRTRTPTNSIWLAAVGAFILGVPYIWSPTAYAAVTSIAVIGLYVAYVMPVYLRLLAGDRFKPGRWSLGVL